jgi:hypothetical protein
MNTHTAKFFEGDNMNVRQYLSLSDLRNVAYRQFRRCICVPRCGIGIPTTSIIRRAFRITMSW